MDKKLRNPTAAEMGRKGGKARIAKLTKAERRRLAKLAAEARWSRIKAAKKTPPARIEP